MKKHGISHGMALLVCTVTAALLTDTVRKYVPSIHEMVGKFSAFALEHLSMPLAPEFLGILFYATVLAMVWGAAFSLVHAD